MFLFFLMACQQPSASLFQTLVYQSAEYSIENREIPPLTDPAHMIGEYGSMYAGGVFKMDLETTELVYKPGRRIRMQYTVRDDVFLPLDRDGLILLSFYAHLYDTVQVLEGSTLDPSELFPIDMAVTPHISDLSLAFMPMENAAYMPTTHAFILLSDLQEKEVPLAANAGIVAHEFGHSVFHYLTTGGVHTDPLYALGSDATSSMSSLDEGFADMLAALVTLDPRFIEASLDMPERDLSGEQLAMEVDPLPEDHVSEGVMDLYDPYALGSVYAAVAWDIYKGTQDQMGTLDLVFQSVSSFAELPAPEDSIELKKVGYRWLDQMVANASVEEKELACQSIAVRFASVYEVAECL